MAREDNSLDQVDPTSLVRKREKNRGIGERNEWDFRERSSTLSLGFPAIEPSVFGEARNKLLPTARATRGYRSCGVLTNSKR